MAQLQLEQAEATGDEDQIATAKASYESLQVRTPLCHVFEHEYQPTCRRLEELANSAATEETKQDAVAASQAYEKCYKDFCLAPFSATRTLLIQDARKRTEPEGERFYTDKERVFEDIAGGSLVLTPFAASKLLRHLGAAPDEIERRAPDVASAVKHKTTSFDVFTAHRIDTAADVAEWFASNYPEHFRDLGTKGQAEKARKAMVGDALRPNKKREREAAAADFTLASPTGVLPATATPRPRQRRRRHAAAEPDVHPVADPLPDDIFQAVPEREGMALWNMDMMDACPLSDVQPVADPLPDYTVQDVAEEDGALYSNLEAFLAQTDAYPPPPATEQDLDRLGPDEADINAMFDARGFVATLAAL